MVQKITKTKPMVLIKMPGGGFKLSYMRRLHMKNVSFRKMYFTDYCYNGSSVSMMSSNIKEIRAENIPSHSVSDVKYCFPGLNRYKYDNRTRLSEYKPLC